MKKRYVLTALSLLFAGASLHAQDWNKELYPDYSPEANNPDARLVKFIQSSSRKGLHKAAEVNLPDHWNNAETKHFPPTFNQAGGSCGSASRYGYMFTHEINALRDADGSLYENQYPTHFIWLHTSGNDGKNEFGMYVGIPNAPTYGGRTYSSLFGYQEETNNDYGWMTGYDKWYSGFFNRMTAPTMNPYSLGTDEGRLAAKAWLYNHAGDDSFKTGGVIGLGVASGGVWKNIPKTATNQELGVAGMYYVDKWGIQVDHALTLVGYDDRIEFDLDNNGKFGEVQKNANGEYVKDEKGAWIIANSWGDWCNGGFIYCPYAYAGTAFRDNGTPERDDDIFNGDFWYGELYNIRKDYRPFRTIKLRMDYNRRSEMLLQAGVSSDLNATEPESLTDMHFFRYAGDGKKGSSNPAPLVPMLGRWADGKLHSEPMEFGYDLTDLSAGYDRNQPLKYFFIVNTRDWAQGTGNIHYASIIDYEHDLEGIETPFDLGEAGKVEIKNAGKKTIISVVVPGAAYNAPIGLAVVDGKLVWNKPMASGRVVKGYNIYKEEDFLGYVNASTLEWPMNGSGTYSVEAVYSDGRKSLKVSVATAVEKPAENVVINLSNGGFSIPDIFTKKFQECTIEYWIRPNSLINWNNAFGPGWGTFYVHCNANGAVTAGWNTGAHRMETAASTLRTNAWTHLTLIVKGNKMTLYKGNTMAGEVTSSEFSGVGGFGNLVFDASGNKANDCSYDEIRIWNYARTEEQISSTYPREFHGDVMPAGLIAYYKGDTFEKDGAVYLRDCVGGHHALFTNNNFKSEVPTKQPSLRDPVSTSISMSIDEPVGGVTTGVPVTLTATRSDAIRSLQWSIPALDIKDRVAADLTVIFPKEGTYDVTVKALGYESKGTVPEVSDTRTITVSNPAAPVAEFVSSADEIIAGEHISFYVKNAVAGCAYEWSLPGTENEKMYSPKVATSYLEAGTYTVTLTVTSPSGEKAQCSKQILVNRSKPSADFFITRSVIMKGDSTILVNRSKHEAQEIQWSINSPKQKVTVNGGQNYTFRPTEPGIYSVALKASNDLGSDEKTQERAIIVTNADSKNGLSFNSSSARVELQKPIVSDDMVEHLTISWWMYPVSLKSYCLGLGENATSMMLRTDAQGNMQFCAGGAEADSRETKKAFVIANEWHHYAVTYNNTGRVRFYRDGVLMGTVELKKDGSNVTSFACPQTFGIGLESAPMNGVIDELSIWQSTLTLAEIKEIANEPIADPELYITGEKAAMNLRAYYQFNQNSGDVEDLTSYKNTGKRVNFGPDGDAWGLSSGVFCLNFGEKKDDLVVDGISNIKGLVTKGDAIFNMKGQRVSEKDLTPGIYIQQGRKIIVK